MNNLRPALYIFFSVLCVLVLIAGAIKTGTILFLLAVGEK